MHLSYITWFTDITNVVSVIMEESEEDPLVYQTGHRDDKNSPECIVGKVHIINVAWKQLLFELP